MKKILPILAFVLLFLYIIIITLFTARTLALTNQINNRTIDMWDHCFVVD